MNLSEANNFDACYVLTFFHNSHKFLTSLTMFSYNRSRLCRSMEDVGERRNKRKPDVENFSLFRFWNCLRKLWKSSLLTLARQLCGVDSFFKQSAMFVVNVNLYNLWLTRKYFFLSTIFNFESFITVGSCFWIHHIY